MSDHTPDPSRSPVDDLDESCARLRMAVVFLEGVAMDRPDPTWLAFYRRLVCKYAAELADAATRATDAAA